MRRKHKIRPGGKPVEKKPEPKNKFREILSKRMLNFEDSDLERTTRAPELPGTILPEL